MSFVTVGAPTGVTMSATAPANHRCPFVKEADYGTVTVTWETRGRTFELHSLRRHLDEFMAQWGEVEVSHEEFTQHIRDSFEHGDTKLRIVRVETNWDTAGMPVSCSI
jgi:NADPH-dependent 7-cyano-7-deazaguanine reductase QueF